MIAIFSVNSFPSWFSTFGTNLFALLISCSAMNFLISSIATDWSMVPRVHASSQRLLQIAPQTAGNGFSCLMSFNASMYLPCAAIFTYP